MKSDCLWYTKKYITEAPKIWYFEPVGPVAIETDVSDCAIATVLAQVIDGRLHRISYHFWMMGKAKINYEIYNKEMLAILSALKE
jgi:hypothetical protein